MSQHYSDPSRENDPHTLPDIEVFYISEREARFNRQFSTGDDDCRPFVAGWYWWSCFPGCLPDGDLIGPFATEAEALADARGEA